MDGLTYFYDNEQETGRYPEFAFKSYTWAGLECAIGVFELPILAAQWTYDPLGSTHCGFHRANHLLQPSLSGMSQRTPVIHPADRDVGRPFLS